MESGHIVSNLINHTNLFNLVGGAMSGFHTSHMSEFFHGQNDEMANLVNYVAVSECNLEQSTKK